MKKQKLINIRKERKISQSVMAYRLGMEQSQYCRREKGETRISELEWNKIATILEVKLVDIFEPFDVDLIEILNDKSFSSIESPNKDSQYLFDKMKNYIEKLEEENKYLKSRFGDQND